jgi:hypothetical protein
VISGGEKLTGKAKNLSRLILFGVLVKLADIPVTRENRILRSNIESNSDKVNGVQYGIKCITGNWQMYLKENIVLPDHESLKNIQDAL